MHLHSIEAVALYAAELVKIQGGWRGEAENERTTPVAANIETPELTRYERGTKNRIYYASIHKYISREWTSVRNARGALLAAVYKELNESEAL